jgi:hypothetical protein
MFNGPTVAAVHAMSPKGEPRLTLTRSRARSCVDCGSFSSADHVRGRSTLSRRL